MSLKSTSIVVAALVLAGAIGVGAQQKLGDLVSENGYDWLIGKWAGTTDQGDKIEFEYKWALDKHVIITDFKMGEYKSHGMIVFVPSREEVMHVGADNRGGTSKGVWSDEYGSAVHRMEHLTADGETRKADIIYTKVNADTMKVAMYGIDSSGSRASEPWGSLEYKRQVVKDSNK